MSLFQRLSILSCLLFGWGCKKFTPLQPPSRTLQEDVVVTRQPNGTYLLEFAQVGPHQISVAAAPEALDWATPSYVASGKSITITEHPFGQRRFFGIIGPKGKRRVATERLLPLRGALNVRDLGGLPVGDSLRTRWGLLYRAGHLSDLTSSDVGYLEALDLKTIVDFRSDFEIERHPNTYLRNLPLDYRQIPIGDKAGNVQQALRKRIRKANPETFDSRAFVADLNRQFVDSLAYQYRPFTDLLLERDQLPLLFHCSAGKDRTGFAAAIILDALGVDRELIMADFLMSNYYRYDKNASNIRKATLAGVDQRIAEPLVVVDESYLQNAFDEIDRKFGNTPAFLEAELGIDAAKLERLKAFYLVPVD